MEFSAKQIAAFIQGEIIGDENATVHTFAKIEEGIPGAISFLSNPKYTPYIFLLVLLEPALSTQMILISPDVITCFFALLSVNLIYMRLKLALCW